MTRIELGPPVNAMVGTRDSAPGGTRRSNPKKRAADKSRVNRILHALEREDVDLVNSMLEECNLPDISRLVHVLNLSRTQPKTSIFQEFISALPKLCKIILAFVLLKMLLTMLFAMLLAARAEKFLNRTFC
ncbi:uncharacterized protein BDR25DRAFT_309226 [Lindgomyces ingoldianus]|uniref:Uncharacterized protein n=1 Tax=Lindgomyces ingoldianus TaxID=673940 RepID=A0ACB6RED8_9PLEO|nr:uncharacterized protein BDR25DRAFT_309226 [Lindgomyces ingoldianus]KAF2476877.1 hypothetical protein BDR25DRAFT_309226 [Lindgomyces ingoldianus]